MGSSGGGYTPDTYASDLKAKIAREQWDQYRKDYVPYENKTLDYINDTEQHQQQVSDAGALAGRSFDTIDKSNQRNLARFGISPSAEVAANFEKDQARNKTLAQVDAKNKMRGVIDQRKTALSEEMIGVGKGIKSDFDQTMSAFTELEGLNNQADAQKKAAANASKNQMIGTGASLAITAAMYFA